MELPLGFGMALAQNEQAMKKFEEMTREQKTAVINSARRVNSKNEMNNLVDGILKNNFQA